MAVIITIDRVKFLEQAIAAFSECAVIVGIPSDSTKNARDDAVETNSEIGMINEFGEPAANIPPRPFLIPGVINAMPKNEKIMMQGARKVFDLTVEPLSQISQVMESVGLVSQNAVQSQIIDGEFIELAESTIEARRARGFMGESPLIETSSLKNSITFVVKK